MNENALKKDKFDGSTPRITYSTWRDGAWATKLDHINSWLLHNPRSSDTQIETHKSMLRTHSGNEGVHDHHMLNDDKEWSRTVVKYWLLDSAAVMPQDLVLSTIGAVDSTGLCHDARDELKVVEGVHTSPRESVR